MGSNRRYPHLAEQRAQERELREARKSGPLRSLTPEQIALHRYPLTVVPEHVRRYATAWLRFGDVDVRAMVRVCRWTERAVGVEVTVDEEVLRCYVWRGACGPPSEAPPW